MSNANAYWIVKIAEQDPSCVNRQDIAAHSDQLIQPFLQTSYRKLLFLHYLSPGGGLYLYLRVGPGRQG